MNTKKTFKLGFLVTKFVEFCKRTDLHGYKYIVMDELHLFERCCWAIAVLVSTVFACIFVVTAYNWYARNPIVTVIESTHGAIWDIPFPSVTICDLNVISRKTAKEFARNLTLPENTTADSVFEIIHMAPLLHATFKIEPKIKQELHKLQTVLDLNNIGLEAFFKKLSPASSCSRLVQRCMWKNSMYRCDQLFQQVFVHTYLCCVFNYFAVADRSQSDATSQFPRRVASCGYQTALTVLLNIDTEDYYSSSIASQGVLVLVDNAYNVPELDSPIRMVNPSTEVLIALSPEQTYATSGIETFKPKQRQCYFQNEVKLGNMRQYSYHNCIIYRKLEILKKACDCVPFFSVFKESYRTCSFRDMECLENIDSSIIDSEYKLDHAKELSCLPECEHYEYPLEVALGLLTKDVHLKGLSFFEDIVLGNHSVLNVFFNGLVSTRYRRDVYLNWQNILASFGGLLSLMLGFTLISGVDLIIFFSFRIAYDAVVTVVPRDVSKKLKRNKIYVQELQKKNNWVDQNLNSNRKIDNILWNKAKSIDKTRF